MRNVENESVIADFINGIDATLDSELEDDEDKAIFYVDWYYLIKLTF